LLYRRGIKEILWLGGGRKGGSVPLAWSMNYLQGREHARQPWTVTKKFKVGDRVTWNSEAGYVSGIIIKVHTKTLTTKDTHITRRRTIRSMRSRAARRIMSRCTKGQRSKGKSTESPCLVLGLSPPMHAGLTTQRLFLFPDMTLSFFTIGHSTRSAAAFVDLLRASQVELVVDVRHMPRSRNQRYLHLDYAAL
jgi:hypothetical protein